MRFAILGTTRAWHADGSAIALGGPARRGLLALLLVRAGDIVTADDLIDGLYGEQPPKGAQHALHSQVSRLRAGGLTIDQVATGYRLVASPEDVDAHRFLRLADEGRLREALDLWDGQALADVPHGHPFATHLNERRLDAIEDRAEADLRRGERGLAAELAGHIAAHPLRERLRALHMRALLAEGRQAEALIAYEEARRLLADELGADPSPELSALHQAILRGSVPSPAPVRVALTSFVGRDADIASVDALLRRARLVTLLGPGGAGKTRLSIEVAAAHPDVCFVELAPLREGDDLRRAILSALDIRESAEADPLDLLNTALAARAPLLVLDNCEHVVGEAAALAEQLLAHTPSLRILATSREPLGFTAEHLWPVGPLSPADAVRLFTDRASAVRPDFAPSAEVERICDALDGLPLAIELAAARMRTHDAAELAERLDDRFALLSRGSRTADARHQTLRAVVAWSWDLLSEPERLMARRLTVFTGGATAQAASRVCGVDDAQDVLDSLADKSLLEVAGGRYRMLETIRAFCGEQLGQFGLEAEQVRHAHAAHFLDLAATADPLLRTADQLRWLQRLTAEHDNLLGALRLYVSAGDAPRGMRMLAALSPYLWMRGLHTSVTAEANALLDLAGPDPGPDFVLSALITGEPGPHRATAERLITDHDVHPLVTYLWPMITAGAGASDPTVAVAVLNRGRQSADDWTRAAARLAWGYPQVAMGEFASAEREFGTALGIFRSLGDRWGATLVLDSLAWLADISGDPARALEFIDEAIGLTEQLGATQDLSDLVCNRGDYRIRDDVKGAQADYTWAAELARRSGNPTYLAAALRGLADVARLRGDNEEARSLYGQALDRFNPHWVKSSGHRARSLVGLGLATEDPVAAERLFRQAVEVSVTTGALPEGARAIAELARLAEGERAAELLGAAAVLRGLAGEGDPFEHPAYRAAVQLSHEEALRLVGVAEEVLLTAPLSTVSMW